MKSHTFLFCLAQLALLLSGCRRSEGDSVKKAALAMPTEAPTVQVWGVPMSDGPEIPAGRVLASAKAPDGSLWFALDHGFARFDPGSKSFEYHAIENRPQTLIASRAGIVWIGTDKGLLKYEPKTRNTTLITEGLPGNEVRNLLEDSEGRIWCAVTKDGAAGGPARVHPQTNAVEVISTDEERGIPKYVSTMFQDKDGYVWLAVTSYVLRVDPKTNAVEKYPTGIMDGAEIPGAVLAMHPDSTGALWFATYHGVTRRDGTTKKFETMGYAVGFGDETFQAITETDDALWFGTEKGLVRFDKKEQKSTRLTRKDGLTDDSIQTLLTDNSGQLWIGTKGGGVNRFDPKPGVFSAFMQRGDIGARGVRTMGADARGRFWIGASSFEEPLFAYDGASGAWTPYTTRDGLEWWVLGIFNDDAGQFWAGGHRYDPQTNRFARILPPPESVANRVGNYLWYTTFFGVERANLSEGKVDIRYKEDDGLAGRARVLAVDAKGFVWVGTDTGLNRIDRKSKTVATFKQKDGLPSDKVQAVFAAKDGKVWFGADKGLWYFDEEKKKFTTVALQGFPDARVDLITQDAAGALWLAGGHDRTAHVWRLDPQTGMTTSISKAIGMDDYCLIIAQATDGAMWIARGGQGVSRVVLADPVEAGLVVTTGEQHPLLTTNGNIMAFTRPTGLSIVEMQAPGNPVLTAKAAEPVGAHITAFASGPSGAIWAGTALSGLVLHRAKKSTMFTKAEGLPSMTVTGLATSPSADGSRVWIGTGGGPAIGQITGDAVTIKSVRWNDMPTGPVSALTVAPDGSAYVAYNALAAERFYDVNLAARRSKTRILHISENGLLDEVPVGEALATRRISALAYDDKHGLWTATDDGLFLAGKKTDGHLDTVHAQTLEGIDKASTITRIIIAPDAAHTLWMVTQGADKSPARVFGYRPESKWFYEINAARGLPAVKTLDLALDGAGNLVGFAGETMVRGKVFEPVPQ